LALNSKLSVLVKSLPAFNKPEEQDLIELNTNDQWLSVQEELKMGANLI